MKTIFLPKDDKNGAIDKKVRIETYGCQMNVADSEVVATMMEMAGYSLTEDDEMASAVLLNTCSIRDNAEQKIYGRISYWNALRRKLGRQIIIGVIGCMAERLKEHLINDYGVDIVAGPDSYLDIPNLVAAAENGHKAINIELSTTETYRDIIPKRIGTTNISGYIPSCVAATISALIASCPTLAVANAAVSHKAFSTSLPTFALVDLKK